MTTRFRKTVLAVLALGINALLALPASADLINWNESDIQASGDIVEVVLGVLEDADRNLHTTLTLQWQENDTGDDLWTAIGVDTIFYNSSALVVMVLDQDGADVTGDWNLNFGGQNSGGGFGSMLSKKNLNAGGTGGIFPNSITLVLDSVVTLTPNSPNGGTISAHVRYGQDCSGWVSDGRPNGDGISTSGSCVTRIPEPTPLALFGIGLIAMGIARKRAN